jgi:hypothetical protein
VQVSASESDDKIDLSVEMNSEDLIEKLDTLNEVLSV